jgi:hypothetical protein
MCADIGSMWRKLRWGKKFTRNGAKRRPGNGSGDGSGSGHSCFLAIHGHNMDTLRSGRQYLLVLWYQGRTLRLQRKVCDQNRNWFHRM